MAEFPLERPTVAETGSSARRYGEFRVTLMTAERTVWLGNEAKRSLTDGATETCGAARETTGGSCPRVPISFEDVEVVVDEPGACASGMP